MLERLYCWVAVLNLSYGYVGQHHAEPEPKWWRMS